MKPKIYIVCTQMEAAGVQTIAINMAERLREMDVDSKVIFLYSKRDSFECGENVITLLPQKTSNPIKLASMLFRLWNIFIKDKPDAVIGKAHYSSPIATSLAALAGVPVRVATQTSPPNTHNIIANMLDIIASFAGIYTKNVCASYSMFSCFEKYPKFYKKNLVVIQNGIKFQNPTLSNNKFGSLKEVESNSKILLSIGRLSHEKNHIFLLDLIENIPEVLLYIVGGGELEAFLAQEISRRHLNDRVRLIGEVPAREIPKFLALADVFLFPSKYEAFGLVAAEAMAAGLPIIASDIPAAQEVVGTAGSIAKLDLDLWKAEVMRVLYEPGVSQSMSEAGLKRAQIFSLDRMVQQYMDVCFRSANSQ